MSPREDGGYHLESARPAVGARAGSARINDNAVRFFKSRNRKLKEPAESMGLTADEYVARWALSFEGVKTTYDPTRQLERYMIMVQGVSGASQDHDVTWLTPLVRSLHCMLIADRSRYAGLNLKAFSTLLLTRSTL